MATLLEEFKAITNALSGGGIEYAVCGGWAMALHGVPRATIDIDLMLLSEDLEGAWKLAHDLGYDVEGLPLHFGEIEIRRISKIDRDTKELLTLDFILVTNELQQVWNERQSVEWSGGNLTTVSKQGLIRMKTIAGRSQDIADIERLREIDDES